MGRGSRWKTKRLAKKLTAIRMRLGLSQNGMVDALGLKGRINREVISTFERGTREPPYPVLLRYARLAGVSTDVLIDDKLDLPS